MVVRTDQYPHQALANISPPLIVRYRAPQLQPMWGKEKIQPIIRPPRVTGVGDMNMVIIQRVTRKIILKFGIMLSCRQKPLDLSQLGALIRKTEGSPIPTVWLRNWAGNLTSANRSIQRCSSAWIVLQACPFLTPGLIAQNEIDLPNNCTES